MPTSSRSGGASPGGEQLTMTRKAFIIGLSSIPVFGIYSFLMALSDIEAFDASEEAKVKMDEARIRALAFVITHMAYTFAFIIG